MNIDPFEEKIYHRELHEFLVSNFSRAENFCSKTIPYDI